MSKAFSLSSPGFSPLDDTKQSKTFSVRNSLSQSSTTRPFLKDTRVRHFSHSTTSEATKQHRHHLKDANDSEDSDIDDVFQAGVPSYTDGPTRENYQRTHRRRLHSSFERLYEGLDWEIEETSVQRRRSQPSFGELELHSKGFFIKHKDISLLSFSSSEGEQDIPSILQPQQNASKVKKYGPSQTAEREERLFKHRSQPNLKIVPNNSQFRDSGFTESSANSSPGNDKEYVFYQRVDSHSYRIKDPVPIPSSQTPQNHPTSFPKSTESHYHNCKSISTKSVYVSQLLVSQRPQSHCVSQSLQTREPQSVQRFTSRQLQSHKNVTIPPVTSSIIVDTSNMSSQLHPTQEDELFYVAKNCSTSSRFPVTKQFNQAMKPYAPDSLTMPRTTVAPQPHPRKKQQKIPPPPNLTRHSRDTVDIPIKNKDPPPKYPTQSKDKSISDAIGDLEKIYDNIFLKEGSLLRNEDKRDSSATIYQVENGKLVTHQDKESKQMVSTMYSKSRRSSDHLHSRSNMKSGLVEGRSGGNIQFSTSHRHQPRLVQTASHSSISEKSARHHPIRKRSPQLNERSTPLIHRTSEAQKTLNSKSSESRHTSDIITPLHIRPAFSGVVLIRGRSKY